MPASVKASLAARWCSASTSMVVSTPSAAMPPSRYSPETPAPVPISTTLRAPVAAASTRRVAPPAGPTGTQPNSRARSRAPRTTSSSFTNDSAYATLATFTIASATSGTLSPAGRGDAGGGDRARRPGSGARPTGYGGRDVAPAVGNGQPGGDV